MNLSFNWKIICEFCIRENIENILFLEDYLLITNKLWDNYFEKKKILKVIDNNKDKCLIFHFGQWPILSIPVSNYIARGLCLNTQCILINKLAAKVYLNIYSQRVENNKNMLNTDLFYLFNNSFKKYSLIPNNIFFQKSNPGSNSNIKKFERFCYRSQYLYTARYYYQYDPKFVGACKGFKYNNYYYYYNFYNPNIIFHLSTIEKI